MLKFAGVIQGGELLIVKHGILRCIMKIGDLIRCKNRYAGVFFLVLDTRIHPEKGHQMKAISFNALGAKTIRTKWCRSSWWEVISESR